MTLKYAKTAGLDAMLVRNQTAEAMLRPARRLVGSAMMKLHAKIPILLSFASGKMGAEETQMRAGNTVASAEKGLLTAGTSCSSTNVPIRNPGTAEKII